MNRSSDYTFINYDNFMKNARFDGCGHAAISNFWLGTEKIL